MDDAFAWEGSDEERCSAKVQNDNMQRKLQAPGPRLDKQPSARLLRNGKVRVIEASQRKAKRQGGNEFKAVDHSESNIKEKLESEDLVDLSQNKALLHFPEDEEHRKLLTLLEEQRLLLQTQTAQKKTENFDDVERSDSTQEKPEKLKDEKAPSEMHESEDDVPLSKFLKHDIVAKEQEGEVQDVEDDELLFSVLNKVKSSKKRSKVIGTPKAGSKETSTADLDRASMKASTDTEVHIITSYFPHNTSKTSENCLLHLFNGDSLTIEHSIVEDSVSREMENSKLIVASLSIEDLKVDDSISKLSSKEDTTTAHSEPQKMSVEETVRTVGKKNKGLLTTEEALERRRIPADEPLYASQKNSRLLSHHKTRNMVNKRINADSLNQHPMPEVACPDLTAAHEKEMVSAGELKALQEELQPIIAQRQQDNAMDLTNDLIEKWIEVNCKQLHASFDRHFSIVQHFLCHSQGSCDQ